MACRAESFFSRTNEDVRRHGHDAHFLQRLDRITREQTEFALGLYRDHVAVKSMLGRIKLAPTVERVALAVDDGGRGPHVVVTRGGAFVTCLGVDMSTGQLPVISRARVDGYLRCIADERRRLDMAERIGGPSVDGSAFLSRMVLRKSQLTREEWIGLSAFAPLLAADLYAMSAHSSREVVNGACRRTKPLRNVPLSIVDAHEKVAYTGAHALVLAGSAGRPAIDRVLQLVGPGRTFSRHATTMSDPRFVYRGIWAAGKVGKALIPSYRESLTDNVLSTADAVLALSTIALRHSGTASDVVRILKRAQERYETSGNDMLALVVDLALRVLASPEEALDRVLLEGARRFAATESAHRGEELPVEDVPDDLAATAWLSAPGDVWQAEGFQDALHTVPLLARITGEAFYYPESCASWHAPPWTSDDMAAHYQAIRPSPRLEPVRYDARVGRNEPCPCESGKKFKRCCAL